ADVLRTVRAPDVRLPIPRQATRGGLVIDGWTAWPYMPGEHRASRWLEVIDAGDRFHRAVADVDRPDFIAARTDPWAIGDRIAWDEASIDPYLGVPHVARLAALRRPVDARRQLIHGDLTGNVLFADDLPPAVIDFSPYWRPTAFATAIIIADAVVWEGADRSLLDAVAAVDDIDQMLVRALLYRIVAAVEGGFEEAAAIERHYEAAADLASELVAT
ncbi:MAG TPA: aminoglycoside phosphotransferase, partial [Methylomirabilota bacterium]|nr:aminoglycoside phosphotransferase [Methylomirabilota bacterium]